MELGGHVRLYNTTLLDVKPSPDKRRYQNVRIWPISPKIQFSPIAVDPE
jgi:hypothetical protein